MEKENRLILEALDVLLRNFNLTNQEDIDTRNNIQKHLESERIIEKYHQVNEEGNKELKQQAEKDLEKKGDNIIPTLCKSCNCMTKTISTRTESYCGKCKKPKAI